MLKGLELFKTLQNGDKVAYRGKVYTVQSVQHDYDFTAEPANEFCYAAELIGVNYYYLKNLPDDPTLPIIRALEPVVETPPQGNESVSWSTRLVRYQVVRSDGKPYGLSVLVPLSKVLEDCGLATERGILFTLDYKWNGHEGMFVHQQLPEWY